MQEKTSFIYEYLDDDNNEVPLTVSCTICPGEVLDDDYASPCAYIEINKITDPAGRIYTKSDLIHDWDLIMHQADAELDLIDALEKEKRPRLADNPIAASAYDFGFIPDSVLDSLRTPPNDWRLKHPFYHEISDDTRNKLMSGQWNIGE